MTIHSLLILFLAIIPLISMAIEPDELLKQFYTSFQKAEYRTSLSPLDELSKISGQEATAYYWQGIVYNKLEKYNDSIAAFKKADFYKANFKDFYYEYAQALYAANIMAPARKAFGKSIINKHKMATSLYYMGFISQTLEDYKLAINYYKKINQLKSPEASEVNQAARFQLAEIYYLEAKKSTVPLKVIEDYCLPEFKYALSLDRHSGLAPDIQKRIYQIMDEFDLLHLKMINGRNTLTPRYFLRLSQEIRYDSNVILQANQVLNEAQQQSSPASRTDVLGRYAFYPNKRVSIIPEFRGNYTKYFNNTDPNIYKNDNYSLTPAIRTSYEWTARKKMASHLFDFDYNYTARDVYQAKELVFNGRALTYMIGEKINPFSFGETIIRLRRKDFTSYVYYSDSQTYSIALEQTINFLTNHVLFISSSLDQTKVTNRAFDTNSFMLRFDYITPRFRTWFTPTISLMTLLNDPINQKETRGLEKMINPGIKLSRGFHQWRGNFKYDFTRNISLDKQTYDYTKHVYGVEIEYLF